MPGTAGEVQGQEKNEISLLDTSSELDGDESLNTTGKLSTGLERIQDALDDMNEKASGEIMAVEQKYVKLRKPYYDKRNELIKKVPNFWFSALCGNEPLSRTVIREDEEECLQHLSNVDVQETSQEDSFSLVFTFTENSFFKNRELVKSYRRDNNLGDMVSKSTAIEWKDGKDLTKTSTAKSTEAGSLKRGRSPQSGFFSWFCDNSDAEQDYIADIMKDQIWANPLNYYLSVEDSFNQSMDNTYDTMEDTMTDEEGESGDEDSEDVHDETGGDEVHELGDDDGDNETR